MPDPDKPAAIRGRPFVTTYTPEVGMAICERLVEGESLSRICDDEGMPSKGQFLRWLAAQPELALLYRQARQLAAELMADTLIEIADEANADYRPDAKGAMAFDGEAVQRSRLRVDTRKWIMSKLLPRYADKPAEAPPGAAGVPDAAGVIHHEHRHMLDLTPEQRASVRMALAAKLALQADDAGG